ncbi:MAG: hypothetical protein ABSC47_02850 [Terracidiphilus sp.]|jgi:hypothetical protein
MDVSDVLKSLTIDTWYKAIMCLGGGVLVASIFFPVHGLTSQEWQLLSGGAFLVGLGEWKNHKAYSYIKPPNAYTGSAALMSGIIRKPDLVGTLFELAGGALFMFGIWKIAHG